MVSLDPVSGREQRGTRPVMVVSPQAFNRVLPPIVLPITTGGNYIRNQGFAVTLTGSGLETGGVVICSQPRTLDIKSRGARFIESAPKVIIEEVMAKLSTIFEEET